VRQGSWFCLFLLVFFPQGWDLLEEMHDDGTFAAHEEKLIAELAPDFVAQAENDVEVCNVRSIILSLELNE